MTRAYFEDLPCYMGRCETSKKLLEHGAEDGQLTVSCAHLALIGLGIEVHLRDECPIEKVIDILQADKTSSEVVH